ncbi:MAG: hypothetical protein VKJ06_08935 [Vampirovibrionales bacterium]|nr:hypothetical protein [Vampirovibrionales bacterium]
MYRLAKYVSGVPALVIVALSAPKDLPEKLPALVPLSAGAIFCESKRKRSEQIADTATLLENELDRKLAGYTD